MNRTHVCLNLCTVAAVSTAARPTTETNAAETNGILSVSLLVAVPNHRLVEPSKNKARSDRVVTEKSVKCKTKRETASPSRSSFLCMYPTRGSN